MNEYEPPLESVDTVEPARWAFVGGAVILGGILLGLGLLGFAAASSRR